MTSTINIKSNLEYILYDLILVENNLKDSISSLFTVSNQQDNGYDLLEPVKLKRSNRSLDEIMDELKEVEKDINNLNLTNGIDYDTYFLNIILENFDGITFNKSMGIQAFNNNIRMLELLRIYLENLYNEL